MKDFKTPPADILFYTSLVAALALLIGSVIALLIVSVLNPQPIAAPAIDSLTTEIHYEKYNK